MFTPDQYKSALAGLSLMLDEPILRDVVMKELDACPYIVNVIEKVAALHLSR